jgi:hypothetical protein
MVERKVWESNLGHFFAATDVMTGPLEYLLCQKPTVGRASNLPEVRHVNIEMISGVTKMERTVSGVGKTPHGVVLREYRDNQRTAQRAA